MLCGGLTDWKVIVVLCTRRRRRRPLSTPLLIARSGRKRRPLSLSDGQLCLIFLALLLSIAVHCAARRLSFLFFFFLSFLLLCFSVSCAERAHSHTHHDLLYIWPPVSCSCFCASCAECPPPLLLMESSSSLSFIFFNVVLSFCF